jgi:LacI family transcriptional regulator
VPNARLTELMREVRHSAVPQYRATLGLMSLFPEAEPWRQNSTYQHLGVMLEGARERAAAHGYKLENFWLKAPGMTAERFAAILEARGIRGLFCLGSLNPEEAFPRELRRFAVVTQGASIPERMHRVVSHFVADARTVLHETSRRGYTRPGLVILVSGDRRTDHLYSASFLSHQERAGTNPPLPVLRAEHWDEAEFHAWMNAHRPDVIIAHQYEPYVEALGHYLARQKIRVPRDLGLVLLDKNPDPARYSGVCQDRVRIGATAVDLLLGRLLLRDFATPEHPKIELVVGAWNEGRTLRAARPGDGGKSRARSR